MDKLVLVERENPSDHPNPAGTHWVCWNRELSIVTYGDTRDEAAFIAGVAEGRLELARQGHGQPASKPESEWITRAEAMGILLGTGPATKMYSDLLKAFEARELREAAGKTIEQIREEHGLPAH